MERIGLAASKMAKGNLFLYNLYVLGIAFIFSFFVFVIVGATVVLSLIIIGYVVTELMAIEIATSWPTIMTLCMLSLTIVITLFYLFAISRNIKFTKH